MRIKASLTILLAGLATAPLAAQTPAAASPAADAGLSGIWLGSLSVGGMKLRLGATIRPRADGVLQGALDSFDQGAMGIPIDSVVATGDSVRFVLRAIGAVYQGSLAADHKSLVGTWTQQGGGSLPLVLTRGDSAARAAFATRRRPQEPKGPFPYRAEEVTFESAPGVKLAGTLTLPEGVGPHPAVVLITGSGPQDRDETLMGHKPFLVLADYLSRRGIAVLRYDDRGAFKSSGNFAASTSVDFAADARAAVAFLRARPDVAKDRVGLVGHSEGGLIAPMVARDPAANAAFIVLLAGPGIPGDEILLAQGQLIGKASGTSDEVLARSRATSKRIYDIVKSSSDTAALRTQVREALRAYGQTLPEKEPARKQFEGVALETQVQQITSPWFRYFLAYDPRPTLRAVTVPVLAVNGTLDLQVPYEANLAAITASLKAAGNRDHKEVSLPNLNHLFQTTKTGSPSEYAEIEETFSPLALQTVGDWIVARTKR